MDELLSSIEDAAMNLLSSLNTDIIERSTIEEKVRAICSIQNIDDEDAILTIVKKLEERFDINMSLGTLFYAENYRPWLDEKRGEIEWYYWNRYKRLLKKNGFPPLVVSALDSISDEILDHLENPGKSGKWKRKGLVVGHVQSGKTANYTGVICKSADAGYRVIIVLAGVINSLRNQTQKRIDSGFTGIDSSRQFDNVQLFEKLIGVGEFNHNRVPITFTTSLNDFSRQVAQQIGAGIGNFKEPVILITKKNTRILENLINWLKSNNLNLDKYPFLLIDDEADHASINTKKNSDEATATNEKIRTLLKLFPQCSYLGYTATPFANVFIDPDTSNEMIGDDLFPRDFILSLDPPDNYIGSSKIFGDTPEIDIVREINDFDDSFPLRHKISHRPDRIPSSLERAICVFILSRAIRILRGQENAHNSMLVNISRFTGVQTHTKLLINDYLNDIRQSILSHYALSEEIALENFFISLLKDILNDEFLNCGYKWIEVQKVLKQAVSPIRVIEVNSSGNDEPLDYDYKNYPGGRNIIAVGGLGLSRGLTLEGLTVSYFIRNSKMYDTLMQMGRWFGYRDGYADLCRIYMSEEASSWYNYISGVLEELRSEFSRMKKAQLTPIDFGLCVRSHPDSLIVTARKKMRTARSVVRQINLEGRLVETSVLTKSKDTVSSNWQAFNNLLKEILQNRYYEKFNNSYFFKGVDLSIIKSFIKSFIKHPASQNTETSPLIEYADWLQAYKKINQWDVLFLNKIDSDSKIVIPTNGLDIKAQFRSVLYDGGGLAQKNRRIGSTSDELAGLSKDSLTQLLEEFKISSKIPAKAIREKRQKPLLMLHILDCRLTAEKDRPIFENGVVAFGISFPGLSGSSRPEKLVQYQVNMVWWNNEYGDTFDEEDFNDE